ncbi:MAG: trimethylamine methyltransferase family protein, partial [Anaerolineae bacterium]
MLGGTPALQPIRPAYRLRVLSEQQLDQLQAATLEILEDVGVHCPSKRVRAIYAWHGAEVDNESHNVRLPPDTVLEAMSHAPRFYTLGARLPEFDLVLDGTATYCGTDGCGVETI